MKISHRNVNFFSALPLGENAQMYVMYTGGEPNKITASDLPAVFFFYTSCINRSKCPSTAL